MHPGPILLSEAEIQARVGQLGREIAEHYQGKNPVLLGIMNGALFFFADLLRAAALDEGEVATITLASYVGTASTGHVRGLETLDALKVEVAGRDVLIIDDILDTGRTLSALRTQLEGLGAKEVRICVLLEKQRAHEISVVPDWVGFTILDRFVIGYGLDYEGRYRSLRDIRQLD